MALALVVAFLSGCRPIYFASNRQDAVHIKIPVFDSQDRVIEADLISHRGSVYDPLGRFRIIVMTPDENGIKFSELNKGGSKRTILILGYFKNKLLLPYVPWMHYRFFAHPSNGDSQADWTSLRLRTSQSMDGLTRSSFPPIEDLDKSSTLWGYLLPPKVSHGTHENRIFLANRPSWQRLYSREISFQDHGTSDVVDIVTSIPPLTYKSESETISILGQERRVHVTRPRRNRSGFNFYFIPALPLTPGEGLTIYARDSREAALSTLIPRNTSDSFLASRRRPVLSATLLPSPSSEIPVVRIRVGGIDRLSTQFTRLTFLAEFGDGYSIRKTMPISESSNLAWPPFIPLVDANLKLSGSIEDEESIRPIPIREEIYQVVPEDKAFSGGLGYALEKRDTSLRLHGAVTNSEIGVWIDLPEWVVK